ncbi:bcl-2-interacting killer isoform X5 [Phocoena sinus]|uniref:bcl-2-interacting killer isoform X5 n=1 Tax=Phocoena sinus TaxID=42100 RepID=UPI0013C4BC94|nr:bcl-2-interacting killer isoform X5 [Phocoena sinus]
MASSTGPRRRRGAPEPRTFEGPETGRPRDAGSPEQELRAERARRPPPTHAQCREEMYQARPLSRNLFLYTFLQNHGPGFLDDQGEGLPGVTNILEFHPVSPYSDGPHYLAMQLASIADEMELRLLLPQFVEPIRMTVYRNCRVSQDGALCPAVWAEPSAWDGLSREDSASGNCRLPCRFSEPHRIAQPHRTEGRS